MADEEKNTDSEGGSRPETPVDDAAKEAEDITKEADDIKVDDVTKEGEDVTKETDGVGIDDATKETDDAPKEDDGVAKEDDDVAKEADDVAKEADDVAKEAGDVAKEADDVAKEADDVAKKPDDVAKEADHVAKEADDVSKKAKGGEVSDGDTSGEEDEGTSGSKAKPADGLAPETRGDEEEIESEQFDPQEEEEKIPDDFFYDYEEHVSKPAITEDSGLPPNMLTLHHSFGYDCNKKSNLYALAKDTLCFVAGNMVEIINFKTRQQTYIRSTSGGGIGALTVHPSKLYIAVAEKGFNPNVNIYEYPSLRLHRILRGGTENAYAFVDFSPDGKLLASMGSDPDYMLTLWDWKQERIVLRSKAFSQDVFRVTFSTELEGQLTSAGIGHIRFWKMARTFTGLKLQGQLGKFGKKEISDIDGYVELPDGKVLSGSEWGNMLLWDGGLIKVEICRRFKKPCHQGPIQQVIMDEGELMTIGTDGYIRVWDFETIDNADTTDESSNSEMEPMNELKVGNDVQLRCMVKSCDPDETTFWYAQDGNGSIWKLDLSFSHTSLPPERLASYHSGPVMSIDTSPITHLVASTGTDFTVRVYDYMARNALCTAKFNLPGTSLCWMPKTVDPQGATILAGFEDGVLRVLKLAKVEGSDQHGRKLADKSELILSQALKPHKSRITTMAVDSTGQLLASGSTDGTVFFISVEDNFEPIGFVRTPSAVTHVHWSPSTFQRNTLLVCCSEGQVYEVEAPAPGKVDTTHTFEIKGLQIRTHQFKSVKSVLRHDEELARLAIEEEERKKREEEERRIRIEKGLEEEKKDDDDMDDEEDAVEEKEKEPPWEPYIPEKPSPVLYGFHAKDEGKFWISMGGFDAGYLYECEFLSDDEKRTVKPESLYEPTRTVPVKDSNDIPIQCMTTSATGLNLYFGMLDGRIRIQPLLLEDAGLMGPYWSLSVHDNNYGQLTQLCHSFDSKFLFSAGLDGNFFSFEMMDEKRAELEAAESRAKLPSAMPEHAELKVDDIDDPKAYSIEDAKQKAEYDMMLLLAEQKKTAVRQTINSMRHQFQALIDRNEALPEHLRISRKEFEMDPEIKKELQRQKDNKLEIVKKEMAWAEAKYQLTLDKIRSRFKDKVECELITVKAFLSSHEVSSYRTAKLSQGFFAVKDDLEYKRIVQALKDEQARLLALHKLEAKEEVPKPVAEKEEEAKFIATTKSSAGDRVQKALKRAEEKKKKHAARRLQWEELMQSKPDANYEDPVELTAIRDAEEHMGDYKLKSAVDYIVPEHLRMNTEKARNRLVVLKELMHDFKLEFNQRLQALRDKKLKGIQEIREIVSKLRTLQGLLGTKNFKIVIPHVPKIQPLEVPEKKYEYNRETLIKFKEEQDNLYKTGVKKDQPNPMATFTNIVAPAESQPATPTKEKAKRTPISTSDEFSFVPDFSELSNEGHLSDLEIRMKRAEEIRLMYIRDKLLQRIDYILKNFDAELRCLRHDKLKLDVELKNADLRHMVLFEELILLKDFEKSENVIVANLDAKVAELTDIKSKITEATAKLEQKKKEIDKLVEKENALSAAFIASLPTDNKYLDYLGKVYRKKIKRSKKKAGEGDDDDSDSESEDDDEEEDEEDEESDEESALDLDICPPDCDQQLYDRTCTEREKRLDIEDALTDEKKNRDIMIKDLDAMQKKAKYTDGQAKTAVADLEAFQLEKQRKLNELDVVVTLNLHQIEYLVSGVLPTDLSPCLVFEALGVSRLQSRIHELEQERIQQKKQKREARKLHVQLIKDRRVFDHRITAMNEESIKMMMDKFGCIVDLEKLESIVVNKQIEEVRDRLSRTEINCRREMLEWDEKIGEVRDELTGLLRQNTERLSQFTTLVDERKNYEQQLDANQKNLASGYGDTKMSDVEERHRLIQLVHLQAQEIEALKDEILMLSRKGGHILPPVQPPNNQG